MKELGVRSWGAGDWSPWLAAEPCPYDARRFIARIAWQRSQSAWRPIHIWADVLVSLASSSAVFAVTPRFSLTSSFNRFSEIPSLRAAAA